MSIFCVPRYFFCQIVDGFTRFFGKTSDWMQMFQVKTLYTLLKEFMDILTCLVKMSFF